MIPYILLASRSIAAPLQCRAGRIEESSARRKGKGVRSCCVVSLDDSSSDNDGVNAVDPAVDLTGSSEAVPAKRARVKVLTPVLAGVLDKEKVSVRGATLVIAATAFSLGQDVGGLVVNKSSLHRDRKLLRTETANAVREEFNPEGVLIVHWDGKLMKDLDGGAKVNRLPVAVSGAGVDRILSVPKLEAGTGNAEASAVADVLLETQLVDKIAGMCFDTTSSNTGRLIGACTLLETKLGKPMLHFTCRHHIFEIVLAEVFLVCLGPTTGPDVLLFKRFQEKWSSIDKTKYVPGIQDPIVFRSIKDVKETVISFAVSQLEAQQPRDDYRELLELVLLFLGHVPPCGVRFLKPGPIHHARWMAKALYSIKIWLFREEFKLVRRERKIRDVCIFLIRVYIKAWYTAPIPVSLPRNDLDFLKQIVKYQKVNRCVATAAQKKILGQLWYLSQELVGFAFFDPEVPVETKRKMVQALQSQDVAKAYKDRVRAHVDPKKIATTELEDFVNAATLNFFHRLEIPTDFLSTDPEIWGLSQDYRHGLTVVQNIRVINDNAERAVALIQDYCGKITNNEEELQDLLQVVQRARKAFPNCKKETLLKMMDW